MIIQSDETCEKSIDITMFKKLFGKKNDGFYMQVEDDTPKAAKPVEKKAPAPKVEAAKPVEAAPPAPAAEAAPAAAPAAPAKVEAVAAPEQKEKKEKKEKKSIKKEKAAKKEEKAAPIAAPVAAAPVAAAPVAAPEIPVVAATVTPRRRPGANMKAYLDLAKEVQIPTSVKK
jgi:hypothetical protein